MHETPMAREDRGRDLLVFVSTCSLQKQICQLMKRGRDIRFGDEQMRNEVIDFVK